MSSQLSTILLYAILFITLVGIFSVILNRFKNSKQKNFVIPPLKPPRPPTISHAMAPLKPKPPVQSAHARPSINED